jgi:hypothetical protein
MLDSKYSRYLRRSAVIETRDGLYEDGLEGGGDGDGNWEGEICIYDSSDPDISKLSVLDNDIMCLCIDNQDNYI